MFPVELPTVVLWSYGFAAVAYFSIAVSLARDMRLKTRDAVKSALFRAAVVSLLWASASLVAALLNVSLGATFESISDTLRYAAWQSFGISILSARSSSNANSVHPRVAASSILLPALLTVSGIVPALLGYLGTIDTSAAFRFTRYVFLAQTILSLVLVEQLLRATTTDSLWKIKPLAIGLLVAFGFDLYFHSIALLYSRIDDDAYAVRGYAFALITPLMFQTLLRARNRPFHFTLSQSAAFQTTTLVVAGVYLLLMSAAGYYVRYLGGTLGGALQLALLFSGLMALVVLAFSGSMRSRLRILIGKHFFRYRYDYREEWLKFTRAISTEEDPRKVGQRVIEALAALVESPGGLLWLKDADQARYAESARWNQAFSNATESADSAFIKFLESSDWVLNMEEFRQRPWKYGDLVLPDWLLQIPQAWLVVPLSSTQGTVGFVVINTSRAPLDVNWEVNDLLRTAGTQAASFLYGILAMEALLEARKFDAFHRMSAFVVHDLKNIVTQLSLMMRNAERHAGNVEFQKDMLETVDNAVDRMRQLLVQLRDGATTTAGTGGVSLERVMNNVKKSKFAQRPEIEVMFEERLSVRGDSERVERVIGHLVQNALDATAEEGFVRVTVGREGGMAAIEIRDNGKGMSAEFLRDQLFRPFTSTKQSGMGIGAYESRQYVQELGGEVRVQSTEGQGTVFMVTLPVLDVGAGTGLRDKEFA